MVWRRVLSAAAALLLVQGAAQAALSGVTLRNSGYEGLVLAIADTVPYDECDQIISNLKVSTLNHAVIYIDRQNAGVQLTYIFASFADLENCRTSKKLDILFEKL
jgi:hypothetical protein